MEYNKLTKAELIEMLNNTISIEKYNKLEENLKLKKKALEEQEVVVKTLQEQIDMEREASRLKFKELEEKANAYIKQIQGSIEANKENMQYTSSVLNKEVQLAKLLIENRTKDNKLVDDLLTLYHEALFENKEEE
jgi:hypothetical protein